MGIYSFILNNLSLLTDHNGIFIQSELVPKICLNIILNIFAPALPNCPYCKTPAPRTAKEALRRTKKRVDTNHYRALVYLGGMYHDGLYGLPRDYKKALQLWMRAGKLGVTQKHTTMLVLCLLAWSWCQEE